MNGRKNIGIRLAVCMLVPALSVAVPAVGDTHYVNPWQSIQAALIDANDGDEIEVAPGTYYEAINFGGKAVRLYSKNGRDVTTINGDGEAHVVVCWNGEEPNTILEGFTITRGGWKNLAGGGMYCENSSPTVKDCTFRDNYADYGGGGMYCNNSSPTVTNCIFSRNIAYEDLAKGGGMRNYNSSPTIINCSFIDNWAHTRGGGMSNDNSSPTIINCSFERNTLSLAQLLGTYGGGMSNESGYVTLVNCTFNENNAAWAFAYGGGLYVKGGYTAIYNCIFWGNSATWGRQIHNEGGLVSVNYSDIQGGWSGTGNINADPRFRDASGRLLGGSPCIDAGLNEAVPAYIVTDLDGNPRIADGDGNGDAVVDMGAYERHSTLYVPLDYATIQGAIDAAVSGDGIEVAPGTYYEGINFLGKAIRLYSNRGPYVTTIDGTGKGYHVVQCVNREDSRTVLEGFTITGGNATGVSPDNFGGGMYNERSSPTVKNCVFTGNHADMGGGMYSHVYNETTFGSPTVINCIFQSNTAVNGAGMTNHHYVNTEVTDCKFSGNTSEYGGGMYNTAFSSPKLTNCTFSNNSVQSWGGGILNYDNSSPTVTNCTFSGNAAELGGGIYNLVNSSPTVTNCILWDNIVGGLFDDVNSITTITYSNVQGGWAGEGNIDLDPMFADADGRLSGGSACIDAGDDAAVSGVARDIDGRPRIADGNLDGTARVDMGAYERQTTLYVPGQYGIIQEAINAALSGDGIEVAPGTYYESINFKGKAVRLYSSGGPDVTTINGNGYYHVVECVSGEDANTILEGFTITGGNATGVSPDNFGGGMYNERSSPTVKNCVFTGNNADMGGGMYSHVYNETTFGSPTVINCIFQSNTAVNGAGMTNHHYVDTEVTDCKFSGNTSEYGGGMYNTAFSSPKLTNCTFSNNSVQSWGGGILNYDNSCPTVTNCTFSGNAAELGGGIYNLVNSSPTVTNCILWDNIVGELFDDVNSITTITYSNVQGGWAGEGNIDTDPCFVDTHNPDPNLWNLRLQQNSPCIDVGNNSTLYLSDFDLDGHPRIIDGDCDETAMVDMGAYEFNYAYMGDLDYNCKVNFFDYSILAGAWETKAGDSDWDWTCDISDPPDDDIDWRDVAILCDNWLTQIP